MKKSTIEITCTIIVQMMWLPLAYMIGKFIVQEMHRSGALIFVRDIIGAYFGTWIIGAFFLLIVSAYLSDRFDRQ